MKRIARWLLALAGPALAAAWFAGWLWKDRSPLTIWFYFIPAPAAAALLGAYLAATRGRAAPLARRVAEAGLVLAGLKMLAVDFAWNRPSAPGAETMRILHWNGAHGSLGVEEQFVSIAGEAPDIVVYSETPQKGDLPGLARLQLGMEHVVYEKGMTLMSKHPCSAPQAIPMDNARGWWSRVDTPQGPLDLAVIDVISHPLLNRFLPVGALADWVAAHGTSVPVLVIGDFNTPRDSLSFGVLRRHLDHAYERAGNGWPYTWPVPLPVYAIDHAWVSARIRVDRYRLQSTRLSDHRRQVMEISLR